MMLCKLKSVYSCKEETQQSSLVEKKNMGKYAPKLAKEYNFWLIELAQINSTERFQYM